MPNEKIHVPAGQEPTLAQRLTNLREDIESNGRALDAMALPPVAVVCSEFLRPEKMATLSADARKFLALLEAHLQAANLNRMSLANRGSAVEDLLRNPSYRGLVTPRDIDTIVLHPQPEIPATATPTPNPQPAPMIPEHTPPRGKYDPPPVTTLTESMGRTILVGRERDECERLGGPDRFERLREIAAAHKLDLSRSGERESAELMLWKEEATTVSAAKCIEEAIYCAAQREAITFAEMAPATRRDLFQKVVEARPDFIPTYGRQAATESPRTPTDATIGRAEKALMTAVDEELRTHGLDDLSPEDRRKATLRVLQRNRDLAPTTYGSRGPSYEGEASLKFTSLIDEALRDQDLPNTPDNRLKVAKYLMTTDEGQAAIPAYGSGRTRQKATR